jgi:hypothetical protein
MKRPTGHPKATPASLQLWATAAPCLLAARDDGAEGLLCAGLARTASP